MGAPYDNIPGVDSSDMFHPDIRTALANAPELMAAYAAKIHTHSFSDVVVTELGTEDLNTVMTQGLYGQGNTVEATLLANYPVAVAGTLKVTKFINGAYTFICQRYQTYNNPTRVFNRTYYTSIGWTSWVENQPLITAGTTAQYYRGDKSWQTLNKSAVGLSAVDNTADVDKPVSNAQATADDKLAKGLVYKTLVTAVTGTIIDAIVNNIPTFTFKANRNYRIIWDFSMYASGNSDSLFYCSINTCAVGDVASSLTGLTNIQGRTRGVQTAYALQGTQYGGSIVAPYKTGSTDVTTQLKFRVQRVVGDDGLIVVGNANEQVQYLIIDDGMQI